MATELTWRDIRDIVEIADKMLDDPKARTEFYNHNEEYYYNKVLDEYIKSKNEADSEN